MKSELFELNFDFAGISNAYNVSVFIDPLKLETLNNAKTPEEVKKIVPYTVNELLLNGNRDKVIHEITKTNNDLTKIYSKIISSLVGIIMLDDKKIMADLYEGTFHYKVNSCNKIYLH